MFYDLILNLNLTSTPEDNLNWMTQEQDQRPRLLCLSMLEELLMDTRAAMLIDVNEGINELCLK